MDRFINLIRSFSSPNVFNPWSDTDPAFDLEEQGPLQRIARLRSHLATDPVLILIAEAPGYQGCRRSGLALTSERLIVEGAIPRVTTHGRRITSRRLPFSEPSATIIWGALHQHGLAERTILWNAFAWHPHEPGDGLTNRKPTKKELDDGKDVLQELVSTFSGVPIVAVGRTSEETLAGLGIPTDGQVRHPANGGATECRQGIAQWARHMNLINEPSPFTLTG
jgi:uracil-DNA glycosylase